MNLKDAYELAFDSRETWSEGGGAKAARINANHVLRILGEDIDVDDVRTVHFTQLTNKLRKEGKAKSTINRVCSSLSTLLSELRILGYELPPVKFKRQSEKPGRPDFFTEQEIAAILQVAKERTDGMLLHDTILFAFKTGCRQGELRKLTEENVSIRKRLVSFLDTKAGRDHHLKMHDDLVPVIERRIASKVDERLFPWDHPRLLLDAFKEACSAAGVPPGRVFHTIRHTTATLLCERGVPIRAVMGVLGHSNVQTTLRYAKASDKSVAAAIDML
jgi:integrase